MCNIKKEMLILGVLAIVTVVIGFTPIIHAAPKAKATICHIPPGNPANAQTISVNENAVPAHLAHGDHTGACSPTDPGGLLPRDCAARANNGA